MVSASFDTIGNADVFAGALANVEAQKAGDAVKQDGGGKIVWLKLLQPQSNEVENGEGQPGDLYLEGVGVLETPAVVIPAGNFYQRKMFKNGNPKQDMLCMSEDGRVGVVQEAGDTSGGYGGACSECPMAVRKGGGRAPCTFSDNVHMFLPEYQALGVFGFSNTGMPASGLIETHKNMAKGNMDGFPLPAALMAEGWGKFAERLSAVPARNAFGNYHKPQVNRLSPREFRTLLIEAGVTVTQQDGEEEAEIKVDENNVIDAAPVGKGRSH